MLGLTALFHSKKTTLAFVLISSISYVYFAFNIVRTDTTKLVLFYIALFIFAYQIIKTAKLKSNILIVAALVFRFIFLIATPNLSQDFYRFIWDGRLIYEGFNPYLYTPDFFIKSNQIPFPQTQELYRGMGYLSASNFTNYPPLNQLCFFIGRILGGHGILGSVIVMRLIIIAADMGVLYFGQKLLKRLKLPPTRIFWYILNPFIIIELTGNLHFEGVMLFFLIWGLYLLYVNQWKWAAVAFAAAISTKLIPLMFLPLFFGWFTKRKDRVKGLQSLIVFYLITGITVLILFLPFFSVEFMNNYSKTVGLWFTNFEFNASIYYLIREIGYAITGYNEINYIGKMLPVITLTVIMVLSYFRENNTLQKLITSMLFAFSTYLFLSTTVHPWYIATLVLLCLFTNYKFPLFWSCIVILSYASYSAIGTSDKFENLYIIALEYSLVFSIFVYEILLKKKLRT